MKLFFNKQYKHLFLKFLFAPLIINFIIEFFSRGNLIDTLEYMLKCPLVFFYNSLIIFSTLSIVLLFKRRKFFFSLITAIWIGFGVTNGIILSNRVTPFTATDLTLAQFGLGIISKYLSKFMMAFIIALLILLILSFIFLFFKEAKLNKKINYKKNILIVASIWTILFASTKLALSANIISSYFGNIAFAYLDYGFPYCFSNTLLNTGIDKPNDYSLEKIESISSLISSNKLTNNIPKEDNILLATTEGGLNQDIQEKTPNIIMVQLESFFDPELVNFLNFSQDPIPNFRYLMENFSSGYLTVPSVGAGTANTEFEVLSGMSLKFFGPGEYPYKTILKESTAESINYDLKELGYSSHAIHNNKGTFYNRNFVFSQLGFDTFTSLEYMNVEEFNIKDWAKDYYLTDEILKSLNSTDCSDFIYTISVQSHGDYPKEKVLESPLITVDGLSDEGTTNSFNYYINQLYEVDQFIGDLVQALSERDEKTVLVLFGDHLPTLGFKDEDLYNGSIFQTQYVIWDNFGLEKDDKNLTSYQLTSSVLNKLNIDNGVLNKFHNQFKDSEDYLADLKLLQYDMLYGQKYIYGGKNPFTATDLKMGTYDITITNVYQEDENLIVKGENFNKYSKVYINDKYNKTNFIDENTLSVNNVIIENESSVVVTQRTSGGGKLSSTNMFTYLIYNEEVIQFQ